LVGGDESYPPRDTSTEYVFAVLVHVVHSTLDLYKQLQHLQVIPGYVPELHWVVE
jgi:hypothetical protein